MRSYIFTPRERRIIKAFLEGKITVSDPTIQQIRSRTKSFSQLAGDVEFYVRLRKAVSTVST